MHLGQPENLWWLLVLVPMIGGLAFYFWWKRKVVERVGHLPMVRKMTEQSSTGRQVTRGILVVLATALLCVSAARPQWGQDDRTLKRFGVDIVFALDISKSMLAQDVPPSRLDASRSEIRKTLTTLTGDRVGLVVFTAVSFAQSPLTTDYGAIRFYLEKLDPNQMPVGGTSIGQAIWDSIDLLTGQESPEDADEKADNAKKADTQIIVLITDGEDHESNPMQMAERAKERGIKIVTVGLGSVDGSRIPMYGPNGQLRGYKRNRQGELVYTKLDETTLRKIADITGGTYVHYSGENSVVNALDEYIDSLEKREIETMLRERYKDRYMYFLAPALLLLLIALGLGERRNTGRRDKRGISNTMLVLFAAMLVFLGGCENAFKDTVDSVDRGNALVEDQQYDQALEAYQKAEKEIPARSELHYDLGLAHLGAENYDNAREAFARALSTDDPQLEFDALFNLGLALSRQEKWKEAFETYKQALRVDLDTSIPANEERLDQARHNLETVYRRLYPPCAQLEDDFEENDEVEAAVQLEKMEKEDLALCGLDDDWFAIPAIPGTNVSVEVDFEELREEPDPDQVFMAQPQDLRLTIFDSTGEEAIAVDQGDPKSFDPDATTATRRIEQFEVTQEMLGDERGMLLLKVGAADGLEFSYDLNVEAIPPCHALEDDFEENDTRATARPIEAGQHQLHYCPGEQDWYSLNLQVGDSLFVDLRPKEDAEREKPPALSAELIRASDGATVASPQKQGPLITLGIREVEQPGEYYLRVRGDSQNEQGPYDAQIYQYAPCPAGDDRFEDNDDPTQAATLPDKPPIHRYLRICDRDRDFFKVGPDKDGKVSWGLRRARVGADDSPPDAGEDLKLDLLDASGDKMLAEGKKPKVAKTPTNAGTASEKPTKAAVDSAVTVEDFKDESALLRVSGPQDFYHLVQLNPQQQNENEQKKDQQKEDDEKKDDGEQDDKKDDGESKKNEKDQKKKDEQKKDEGDESKKSEKQKEMEQKKAEEKAAKEGRKKKSPEKQRMEDILRALEESDSNFQMRKALEDMPERDIERDW